MKIRMVLRQPPQRFHATILHCLGLDQQRLSVKNQGFDVRLSGVEERHVVKAILA